MLMNILEIWEMYTMAGTAPLTPYYSYMLRFWPESQISGETQWRFTLIDPSTGQKRGFASLEALLGYLSQVTQNDLPLNPDFLMAEYGHTPNGGNLHETL